MCYQPQWASCGVRLGPRCLCSLASYGATCHPLTGLGWKREIRSGWRWFGAEILFVGFFRGDLIQSAKISPTKRG